MDHPTEATFYIRISLMNAKPGSEELVAGLMDNLLKSFIDETGYVRGYALLDGDPQGRIGRITVWQSEKDADHAANTQHVLTVRAEIIQRIEQDSHVERSYTAIDPELARAAAS